MLILPFGHDKSVYGRQWLTWLLIAINVVVFAVTARMERGAEERVHTAVDALDIAHEIYPDARGPSAVFASLSPRLQVVLRFITSDDPTEASGPPLAAPGVKWAPSPLTLFQGFLTPRMAAMPA